MLLPRELLTKTEGLKKLCTDYMHVFSIVVSTISTATLVASIFMTSEEDDVFNGRV